MLANSAPVRSNSAPVARVAIVDADAPLTTADFLGMGETVSIIGECGLWTVVGELASGAYIVRPRAMNRALADRVLFLDRV